jgi:uncharacterized protein (DUF885 family)
MANGPTQAFHRLASEVTGELLSWEPIAATWLGDHRFDARLPDFTSATLEACRDRIQDWLTELDAIDDVELSTEDNVDLEILRSSLGRVHFEITELKATTWNPMLWNPGTALHLLNSREFAPVEDRIASMKGRLREIPRFLDDAMRELRDMPRVHVETAIAQLQGTSALIRGQIGLLVADATVTDTALDAVADFIEWLTQRLPESHRSPRLGERLYAATLWHGLDDGTTADGLLQQAESYLDRLGERMQGLAAEYLGEDPDAGAAAPDRVRRALAEIASEAVVTNETVLDLVEQVTASTREFVRTHDLVSIPEIEVRIIEMPEIHRGVAVAYCDAPGPLEQGDVPTFVAVSPTPSDWPQERIASFYREYNAVQLHDLTIHEAFPGHVLQLAHARRLTTPTPVRNFGMSGVFVEGWAVYAEQLMIDRGYAPSDDPRSAIALALQQLKMQARMTINAILDVRVHTDTIDEEQALELMCSRGFQEEGEAVGKWRRALLTAGQLPTYFVGFLAVSSIASDLRVLHPHWSDRELHDLMLSHGSPAPRHLRTLLGI